MKNININIMRHGDGKQVYVTVKTNDGEYIVKGDYVSVHLDRAIPDDSPQVSLPSSTKE